MNPKYRIYVNGFWGGFSDKTDANHIAFFEILFKNSFQQAEIEFTTDLNLANILFESLFGPSLSNSKFWLYKIQYSGEPRHNPLSEYDLTLYSENDGDNILNLPLFVYYIHGNNFIDRLIHKPVRTQVPNKFCCFIVSNPSCGVRNKMFEMLNAYKQVDSCGKFANNMGGAVVSDYWTPEFLDFLSQYKFIICFENTKTGTYSTEKIVNPYLANIIPIYWSSHQIFNVFNRESMLFLENESDESYIELINRIIELDNDDAKYLEFVNRPVFAENGMNYWESNYSIKALSGKLASFVKPNYSIQYFVTHYTPLVDRKRHIIEQLEFAGVGTDNVNFIETKDRDVLTLEEISRFKHIKISEASLFLKHVEIFKTCDLDKYIVVFEDDAILCDDFSDKLAKCLWQLQNEQWDVLFSGECIGLHCETEPGKLVKYVGTSRGACMYVLNCGVARKLYHIFDQQDFVTCPIDWWFNWISIPRNMRYFWSEPTLASQGSETGLFDTTLRTETNILT